MVISGCSGGGKSTLLQELKKRGHRVIEEPGRRVIQAGGATPWDDLPAFLLQAIALAEDDYLAHADRAGWTFCDRSLIDAASALQALTGKPCLGPLCSTYRYHDQVFMVPPWPAIYSNDAERRHDFAAATEEYQRLLRDYPAMGYQVRVLPMDEVPARADFLIAALNGENGQLDA
ncbi:AAA family ATPase [Pseudomonas sp. MM211]|uniref:AAA family ATPase n=1 Tax=Pseudomonas sp. MM211 TaxID=2866808 RepID=UPI001CEC3FCB|nr:AAA family ATPase [Pseudomonas sp. MM211]